MRYLGKITGSGMIKGHGVVNACTAYEFEGFSRKTGGITGSGEIKLAPDALKSLFGRTDLKLLTDSGHLLNLKFSDKKLPASNFANVDITGDLPAEQNWHH